MIILLLPRQLNYNILNVTLRLENTVERYISVIGYLLFNHQHNLYIILTLTFYKILNYNKK